MLAKSPARPGDDSMVIVAALVSRVEALVVASMLEAGGVLVFVGASSHASVSINSLALGGHRLMVPAYQHRLATDLLLEVLGDDEWGFNYGLRRAVLRLIAFWTGLYLLFMISIIVEGGLPIMALVYAPFSALSLPVNPQGRGDYYLADTEKASA